jgi:hypothetical protein
MSDASVGPAVATSVLVKFRNQSISLDYSRDSGMSLPVSA